MNNPTIKLDLDSIIKCWFGLLTKSTCSLFFGVRVASASTSTELTKVKDLSAHNNIKHHIRIKQMQYPCNYFMLQQARKNGSKWSFCITTNNITTLKNHINRVKIKYPSHHRAASEGTEELYTAVAVFSQTSTQVFASRVWIKAVESEFLFGSDWKKNRTRFPR